MIIVVDTQEKHPWHFTGLLLKSGKPVQMARKTLGRWSQDDGGQAFYIPGGDYTLAGAESRVIVERKSMNDAHNTFLDFKDGRPRFERLLSRMDSTLAPAVIVECSFDQFVSQAPATSNRTATENAKTLFSSVIAWQQSHRAQWEFCGSRGMAEALAFRWLERAWSLL